MSPIHEGEWEIVSYSLTYIPTKEDSIKGLYSSVIQPRPFIDQEEIPQNSIDKNLYQRPINTCHRKPMNLVWIAALGNFLFHK